MKIDMKIHFEEYFKKFRDNAPKHMVEWGGYQKGEPTGMASSYESCIAFYDYIKIVTALLILLRFHSCGA